jgi:hypothetical protein
VRKAAQPGNRALELQAQEIQVSHNMLDKWWKAINGSLT